MVASERLSLFGESAIREMTRLSDQYGAINVSQGMPDFDPPTRLVNAAVRALRNGLNQYPITWGQRSLREAIAAKVKDYNGIDADPEKNITVTCGCTEAVTAAVLGLSNPRDLVVVTDPFYENYVPDIILADCRPMYVPFVGRNLILDEERLKRAMERHPKLMMLNTPNNPTGRVLDREELKLIGDLCEEEGTIVIVDEIYEHIVYDGNKHFSLAAIGNMHNQTVTVSGASKTYSVTGWRVGWAIAESTLSNAIRKVHDYLTIGAPTPFQEAVATALHFPKRYYSELSRTYDGKRRLMMRFLEMAGLEYHRPEGAYYILVNAPAKFRNGHEFADYLLKNVGLGVLPADALYHNKELGKRKMRLAFCKKNKTLIDVGRRLKKLGCG